VAEHPSGSASVTAKQGFQPTEVLPTPVSSGTELGANASAAVPPPFASEADPSVTLSSSNEAAGAPSANASASLPTEANDKDPSAIIDWLIENKADDSSP
jgi:hypothetical protein